MLAFASAGDIINFAIAVGALLGGIGYAVGQLLSSRKKGQSEALRIAVEEVEAIKIRADRLEKELASVQTEIQELRKENAILRSVISSRGDLETKLVQAIEDSVDRQTKRLVNVLREGKRDDG